MDKTYDFSKGKRGAIDSLPANKTRITIRVDNDVLDWFREEVHAAGGLSLSRSHPAMPGRYSSGTGSTTLPGWWLIAADGPSPGRFPVPGRAESPHPYMRGRTQSRRLKCGGRSGQARSCRLLAQPAPVLSVVASLRAGNRWSG